ncbi:MAG: hypothetical protein LBK42_04340 [Propionibacteriaceae bacterium]|nr:hypothetical protein [Propionibacteriaceae bacterium]
MRAARSVEDQAVEDQAVTDQAQGGVYVPLSYEVDLDGRAEPKFLRHFNELVSGALAHGWPVVAQARLFDHLTTAPPVSWAAQDPLPRTAEQLDGLDRRVISDQVEAQILEQTGGTAEAWVALGKVVFPQLEAAVHDCLQAIVAQYGGIKAVLMWRSLPSVRQAADRLGVPVVDLELGSIRRPLYRDTMAYFQFGPKFDPAEYERRLARFQAETATAPCPLLTRKEILALFLRDRDLRRLSTMDDYEPFEVGLALAPAGDVEARSTDSPLRPELLRRVQALAPAETVLVRPYYPERPQFDRLQVDHSIDAAEFVLSCRRVVSSVSNLAYETMLYGKTAYIWGPMPFASAGVMTAERLDESVVDLERLNWISFGFFAPYDLIGDQDYLDWRLSQPSETAIYRRHLEYYLDRWSVPSAALELTGQDRMAAFLAPRGFGSAAAVIGPSRRQAVQELARLRTDKATLEQRAAQADERQAQAEEQLEAVWRSNSWRVTKPLRVVSDRLRRSR